MRLCALYDRSGQILAAVRLDRDPESSRYVEGPRPLPQKGQKVAEIDVPEEFRLLSFRDACLSLKVDVKAKAPRLIGVRKRPSKTAK
jgi:hypothetical protein